MPRCFLTKKSNAFSGLAKKEWRSDDEDQDDDDSLLGEGGLLLPERNGLAGLHRLSTLGSIKAALAVQSIQEPVKIVPTARNEKRVLSFGPKRESNLPSPSLNVIPSTESTANTSVVVVKQEQLTTPAAAEYNSQGTGE